MTTDVTEAAEVDDLDDSLQPSDQATQRHPFATYWRQSRRPLVSLVFVAPLLLCYESGVLLLGPDAMRNGADVWLRGVLEWLGFGQYFLLPLVTCAVLLGWHHLVRESWRVSWPTVGWMLVECGLMAVVLLTIAQLQARVFWAENPTSAQREVHEETLGSGYEVGAWMGDAEREAAPVAVAQAPGLTGRLVAYCGAGIYEELLFRLLALPLVALGLQSMGVARNPSWIVGLLATSLFFALAHYNLVTPHGESFDWFTFSFRCLAGCFFAGLFVARGFGVAAGTHALYDILIVFS